MLDETFDQVSSRQLLRERTPQNHLASDLWIELLIDDLHHTRLPDNAAEVIDRSLAEALCRQGRARDGRPGNAFSRTASGS